MVGPDPAENCRKVLEDDGPNVEGRTWGRGIGEEGRPTLTLQ